MSKRERFPAHRGEHYQLHRLLPRIHVRDTPEVKPVKKAQQDRGAANRRISWDQILVLREWYKGMTTTEVVDAAVARGWIPNTPGARQYLIRIIIGELRVWR